MAIKEFAARQAAKRILPLVGSMSDKDLEKLIPVAAKIAPNEFTKSMIHSIDKMCQEQHPTFDLFRKMIRQTSPHVRERMVNSFVIKNHWYGSVRRTEIRNKEGLSVPLTFLISPTMRCNLQCSGCYAKNLREKDDLEFDVIDRILNEGKDLGIFFVTILGGEPFIRQDMWEIYKRHNDVFFQVFTNGTLIDKETARKLEELGNVFTVFSLEGFEEATDARRGKNTFRKVMQGMGNLREVGAPFGFSSMVTRQNVETIVSDEFNDMLVEKGCFAGWHFLYMPVGQDPDTNLMPTAEQRELMRLRGAQRIRNEKPIFVMDFWNDAPYVGGCIAGGRHYFHINSHGDVEPCIFIHMAADNIKQKSFKEVLESPYFKSIRSRQPYDDNLLRPCMIIDHPQVLREICAEFHPYSTDGEAISELFAAPVCGALDNYAEEVATVLDPAWERDFFANGFVSPHMP